MNKKYVVRLSPAERGRCAQLIRAGRAPARTLAHARILLKADVGEPGAGWTDARIAAAVEVRSNTVANVRRVCCQHGLDRALVHYGPSKHPYPRKLDGRGEAYLIATACGAPPAGRKRWTLRLLADHLVALEIVDEISHVTVGRTLKKTS